MLVIVLGTISGYGHLLVVKAFQAAPVSLLAPFHYFEIITGTALGFLIFGEFPTVSKWLGIAIIVGSGLFMIWRERRAGLLDNSLIGNHLRTKSCCSSKCYCVLSEARRGNGKIRMNRASFR